MAWAVVVECPDCEERGEPFSWRYTKMTRDEALPECPVCAALTREGLAAPAINRGAAPDTKIKVPDNKTKQIDMAMRMISEDNGGANMQSQSRVGESVAIAPVLPPEQQAAWGGSGPAKTRQPMTISVADAIGRGDPAVRSNVGMIDSISRRSDPRLRPSPFMKPVYREKKS